MNPYSYPPQQPQMAYPMQNQPQMQGSMQSNMHNQSQGQMQQQMAPQYQQAPAPMNGQMSNMMGGGQMGSQMGGHMGGQMGGQMGGHMPGNMGGQVGGQQMGGQMAGNMMPQMQGGVPAAQYSSYAQPPPPPVNYQSNAAPSAKRGYGDFGGYDEGNKKARFEPSPSAGGNGYAPSRPKSEPNRILLVTLLNPIPSVPLAYSADELHTLYSSHGHIEKIVKFAKGVFAYATFLWKTFIWRCPYGRCTPSPYRTICVSQVVIAEL